MFRPPQAVLRVTLAAFAASALLSGCAAFTGSKHVDVSPFSENTVGMLGEMQKFNRPVIWIQLKKYQSLPSVTAARQAVLPIRALLRGIGLYSMQVVALYDSPLPEDRKISELARYLTDYIRPGLDAIDSSDVRFSPAELDKVVSNIRGSKTFLAALSAAQPLVNATVAHGNSLFDSMDSIVMAAAADVGDRIEAQYAALKQSTAELDSMHVASLHSYALLERFRGGEIAALDTLRKSDAATSAYLPAGRAPAAKDLDQVEHFLIDRSTTIKAMRDQLDPEVTNYRESLMELDNLRNQTEERAKLGRLTLLLWGRSHRNLAAGVSVKPMIDVMGIMKSTVATGAKGILP
jgi:hypothetical protein